MPVNRKPLHRCEWAGNDPLYIDYHDNEWGVPVHDDQKLFEFLILEGAQAGLSWITILKKRQNYRKAYNQFDVNKVARYSDKKIQQLLTNPGIVRNKLKVNASVQNARSFIEIQNEFSSFDQYLWRFVDGAPVQNHWKTLRQIPVTTPVSDALSLDLKQRGCKFVGSTICYAFMQAVGMINDHVTDCFRHREIKHLTQ
ncbi:MAG: DNA-3-methyladenine glycosylase I [Gammaproteobacteria bacterium]|nr:DNA-3-methyladenine glycosylase I [Gammaproteobacteria bacterium]